MKPRTKQILLGLFLVLIGLAWLSLIQFGFEMNLTSLSSNYTDQIDDQRTDLTGAECIQHIRRFAHEIKKSTPNVLFPIIPLGIGFFLVGYACKKTAPQWDGQISNEAPLQGSK